MNGLIALLGSGEYLPVMDDIDRHLLANCGANGSRPRVACLPTGAGREGEDSVDRWSRMGIEHFTRLNADVRAVPVIDKESANDPELASELENSNLIYFSGGNPQHIFETMQGSLAWDAAQKAWNRGAVYAGCSAGAMILGEQIPDFRMAALRQIDAFGILPVRFIMPHFDAIPRLWKPFLMGLRGRLRDQELMLGIDEETALVGKLGGTWTVMGRSQVHVFTKSDKLSYKAGEEVKL
jgi:cyanophycinase